MNSNKDIAFRRIRGRIVPIRLTKAQKEDVAKGVAATAAGASVGLAGGRIYKVAANKSASFAFRATSVLDKIRDLTTSKKGQLAFPEISSFANRAKVAARAMEFSKKSAKVAASVKAFQVPVGVALATYGIAKAGNAITKDKKRDQVKGFAVGAGTTLIGTSFFVGQHGRSGLKTIASKIATPANRAAAIQAIKALFL